jgi:hypothetical protein
MSIQVAKKKSIGDSTAYGKEMYLITGGGKIRCLRCTASSTRTKLQCAKPALKISTTQKCGHHGGKPHSLEALRRIAEANTLHGEFSCQAKEQYRQDAVHIRHLEDAVHLLKMCTGPKFRGRKPAGYRGVYSEEDVVSVIGERLLHRM